MYATTYSLFLFSPLRLVLWLAIYLGPLGSVTLLLLMYSPQILSLKPAIILNINNSGHPGEEYESSLVNFLFALVSPATGGSIWPSQTFLCHYYRPLFADPLLSYFLLILSLYHASGSFLKIFTLKPLSAHISYTRPLPLPTSFSEWGPHLLGIQQCYFLKWNLSDHVALSSDILSFTGNYCLCFAYGFPSLNLFLLCLPVTVYELCPKTLTTRISIPAVGSLCGRGTYANLGCFQDLFSFGFCWILLSLACTWY